MDFRTMSTQQTGRSYSHKSLPWRERPHNKTKKNKTKTNLEKKQEKKRVEFSKTIRWYRNKQLNDGCRD